MVAGRSARQVGWGVADQALSSLTNFVLAIVVARSVDAEDFGAFTLAFAVYTMVLTVGRPLSVDPVTIRYSTDDRHRWRTAVRAATGANLVVGGLAGGVLIALGLVPSLGTDVHLLVVLGLAMPGLLLQDCWRFCFFAAHRGSSAFWNDAVWAVAMFGALVPLAVTGRLSDVSAMACWGLGAWLAALVGLAQARVVPDPRRLLRWWTEHRALVPRLTAEAALMGAGTPATLFAVGLVAGLPAAGALRAGQVLLNALNVLDHGFQLSAVPTAARLATRSPGAMLRFCVASSAGLALAAVLWTGALLLLPDAWGRALLGDTWPLARTVLLPLGIAAAISGAQVGALVGLRTRALAGRSLRARALGDTAEVAGGVGGGMVGHTAGAAGWGLAVGTAVSTSLWWTELLRGGAWRAEAPTERTPAEALDEAIEATLEGEVSP